MRKVMVFTGLAVFMLLAAGQLFAQEITYRVHAAEVGWMPYISSGRMAGTTGQSRRLEAVQLRLTGAPSGGGIEIDVHQAELGWSGYKGNDVIAGTTGQSRQIEAFRVRLTGSAFSQNYGVLYRAHMQDVGWGPWVANGEVAGTTGQSRRIEAIQILLYQNRL